MTIEEDLIYFLKNGKLKNINFAITEKQLAEILGETNSIFKHKYADLYQYGFFEFLMWKDDNTEKLKCITINRPKFKLKK